MRSLREGYRLTLRHFGSTLLLVAIVQGAVAVVAAPLLALLLYIAVRAAGLTAVTDSTLGQVMENPLALLLVTAFVVLIIIALVAQTAVFLTAAYQRQTQGDISVRGIAQRLGARLRSLATHASSLLLVPYLLILVPVAHLGVGSVLTTWVAVPAFVADELVKSVGGAVFYYGTLLILWYLNLRLVLTRPVLTAGGGTARSAFVESWRRTRWQSWRVLGLFAGVLVPALIVGSAVIALIVLPTVASDAIAPDASAVVASVSFGVACVLVFFLSGVAFVIQTQVLVLALDDSGPGPTAEHPRDATGQQIGASRRGRRVLTGVAIVGSIAMASAGTAYAVPLLTSATRGDSAIFAHRGFTQGGVENTIPALEAARAAHADVVEMDVQQTLDGGWVLMHDADLNRLAGIDLSVAQMTLSEATDVTLTVGDLSAPLPSLSEYLTRASEIEQPLLIEIKVHGGESEDYLDGLLEVLEETGGADQHIYHSLSADAVAGLTQRRPDLTVGYIVPISFGGVPDTPADFLVVEQGVYSRELLEAAWDEGKHMLVWTVEDEEIMRDLFRDNIDGIITDHPDLARQQRTDVVGQKGLSARLLDALGRFVVGP